MLNHLKFITLNLTNFSFLIVSLTIFSNSVVAGEGIIDKNCRYYNRSREIFQKIPPQYQGRILSTSIFEINRQKYHLQVLKFPNNTNVFCLLTPNSRTFKRLTASEMIQDKVIEKVEKHPDRQATYIVTVRGNKNEDILRTIYRLNLTNPNQPEVTPLIRVYKR